MNDFIKRLFSRKFLVTVGGIAAVTLYPSHANDIITLIGIYVAGEGTADVVQRYAQNKYAVPAQIQQTTQQNIFGDAADDNKPKVIQPGNI